MPSADHWLTVQSVFQSCTTNYGNKITATLPNNGSTRTSLFHCDARWRKKNCILDQRDYQTEAHMREESDCYDNHCLVYW